MITRKVKTIIPCPYANSVRVRVSLKLVSLEPDERELLECFEDYDTVSVEGDRKYLCFEKEIKRETSAGVEVTGYKHRYVTCSMFKEFKKFKKYSIEKLLSLKQGEL